MELADMLYIAPDSPSGLRWKITNSNRTQVNSIAGTQHKAGYWQVQVNGRIYKAHRLVALLCGILSSIDAPAVVDHIDGNNSNNQTDNLRVCTVRQNAQNLARHRGGHKVGAHFCNTKQRWVATIKIDGQPTHLGSFATEDDAHEAYLAKLGIIGEQHVTHR